MLTVMDHACDDQLERYAMSQLAESELGEMEEHLLVCQQCQDALALTDRYLIGMRHAARGMARHPRVEKRPWFQGLLPVRTMSWAVGLAALGLFVFAGTQWLPLRNGAPAVVVLEATRGADATVNSSAPAGRALSLMLDLAGVPTLSEYAVEIVDGGGRPVFRTSAAAAGGELHVGVAAGLAGGVYYVRVYTPGQELLREYAGGGKMRRRSCRRR